MEITEDKNIREPIGRLMSHIGRMFLLNLNKQLAHLDIERSYFPLLVIEAGNGNLSQQELACKLSCDKVQVVRIIDYLSTNGYVEREQNSKDRRKSRLKLTEKARRYLPDIKNALQQTSRVSLSKLSEEKIDELYSMLRTIEINLTSNTN
jgi:MarR family transcriptional regulator, transcriptional regulator for hemolysin